MTKGDEKAEVFITSFLNRKTSCSLDTQTLELKEQGWGPQLYIYSSGEIISDLLHHLFYES